METLLTAAGVVDKGRAFTMSIATYLVVNVYNLDWEHQRARLRKIKTSVGQFQRLKWQTNMTVRDVEQGSESRCPWGIGRRCWSTRCVVCQIQD